MVPQHANRAERSEAGVILEVHEAVKSYEGRHALAGVSLKLREGEIYALLGPNGAGKTTLVRAVCGRLSLDSGRVRIAGNDPREDTDSRRLLGLAPQEIGLYKELTVEENLSVLGRLAGVDRKATARAIDRALEWTGLSSRARDRVSNLSGGMQRRLNIAAATLHDPRLLVLDEPTVGVDPSARESVHEMLVGLRRSRIAVLLTTHDLDQAETLSDQVGILVDGKLRGEGPVEHLVRDAFSESRELVVKLSAGPTPRDRSFLRGEGLEPTPWSDTWTGTLADDLQDLTALAGRLAREGLADAEIRVRKPGLRSVFFRLSGQDLES